MKNNYLKLLVLGLMAVFIYSCEKDDDEEMVVVPPLEITPTFGIRHDKTLADYEAIVSATGDYPNFGAVVFLKNKIGNGEITTASGVLINNQWILTAGHNFFSPGDLSPVVKDSVTVQFGNDPNDELNAPELPVEMIVLHPTFQSEDGDIYGGNDLCLVKLSTPITNVTPAAIFEQDSEQIGSQIWTCGFGDYSMQLGQNAEDYSKKHAYQNVLDRKTNDKPTTINGTTYSGGHLAYDFDNPAGTVNSLGDANNSLDEMELFAAGGTSASELLPYEGATVTGDSGGPIFIKDGGVWKVAGVLSGGLTDPIPNHVTSGYGDISLFTRTFPMLSWIQTTIQ